MSYSEETTIAGPSRGSADAWFEWASGKGASRPDDVRQYLDTVYEFAPRADLRAELIVTQSIHETSMNGVPWASHWWKTRCNPAGIGITGDPNQNNASRNFENGRNAALAHLVHVFLYVKGKNLPEGLSPSMDPRWENAASVASIVGKKLTLRSFGNAGETPTWAVDPEYGKKWAGWANKLEDVIAKGGNVVQSGSEIGTGATTVTDQPGRGVRFEKRIATRRLGETERLRDRLAWFTIHENGNPTSSPFDEAAFVNNGGGGEKVLYHFSVGVENGEPIIVQIYPADRRGKHAGNSEGNATSLAVETCQAPPGATSEQTQAALEELLFMLFTHDERIDWGTGGHEFSPDRVRPHAGWPGANPGCPATMLRQWGGINRPVDNIRRRLEKPPIEPSENLELIVAEKLFGSVTAGGTTYTFNPKGPVSQQWLARGRESGEYPRLVEVLLLGTRKYFQFSNGMVLWQPSPNDALRQLDNLEV
jgi:hypothetical protein